jgi:hypothetical protein
MVPINSRGSVACDVVMCAPVAAWAALLRQPADDFKQQGKLQKLNRLLRLA